MSEPARLLLMRHARTDWNATGRFQGHTDVHLDDVGRSQAAATAQRLATWAPSRLWSSDLTRARETVEALERVTGLRAVLDPRLREYDVGERSGLTTAEFAARYPDEHAAWSTGAESPRVTGAETTSQVRDRVLPALTDCWTALGSGEVGVVVMHGACLKVGLAALLGWPPAQAATLRGLGNCAWAEVSGRPGHRPRLATYNAV